MRAVVQRVSKSDVSVDGETIGSIGCGLLVLLGVGLEDDSSDVEYLVEKIVNLRIFEDEDSKMNLSLLDKRGELLVISQFTLQGDARRGRRPSFSEAARPDTAEPLYIQFVEKARSYREIKSVETGKFGADMSVSLVNDGPVTMLLDSKREF